MNPGKIEAVNQWVTPGTVKELKSFLGFCSYCRKFIEGSSKIGGPFHDLVNLCLRQQGVVRKSEFCALWSAECQAAFEEKLTSAPILGYTDFSLPFVMETDVSSEGLGSVLPLILGKQCIYVIGQLVGTRYSYSVSGHRGTGNHVYR